jgi:chemotaxis protein histidine kinase CheA
MDDLFEEFAISVREHFAWLEPQLSRWAAAPHDSRLCGQLQRFLQAAIGGARFTGFKRIEQLAIAAETALDDLRYWDLADDSPQVALILLATLRISEVAEAVLVGSSQPAFGEEGLIQDLTGQVVTATASFPATAVLDGSRRISNSFARRVTAQAEGLQAAADAFGIAPDPAAIARLRADIAAHAEAVKSLQRAPPT